MKFIAHYQLYAWECDEMTFSYLEEAKNFCYTKAKEESIRRITLSMDKGDGYLHQLLDIDKTIWVVTVEFFDKSAHTHYYRTEIYEKSLLFINLCKRDNTIQRVTLYSENSKEKIRHLTWVRESF